MPPKYPKKKFRVGVCGHRDLKCSEIEQYKKETLSILQELTKSHHDNEILIISSLAEGADRLVVECAVELGLRYEIILPMDVVLYRKDFDQESEEMFNRLFLGAAGVYTLPLFDGHALEQIKQEGKERDRQYQAAGQEVVDRSDHMLFLYDGVDNGRIGGTADILNYAKQENKSCNIIQCKRETKGNTS